ncbi:response regulator transcription factor [Actinospica sp. MGRD01-02]|uniref:Response regulator transcription factor n=1 Tax=Actinospica acidithermotolerans TaxID=2828514 RepID=A0A941IHI8_9ACTN|nr:response regulator transcription factor [Actinospica acidithermotolerans]MBR7827249.1 response regulator transcription factor [Actinospica acidithermotolerans]
MTRVLVVDDAPELLRTLRIMLSARQYEVVVAVDGAAGLDAAARHVPDLVILDLALPDMDGTEVLAGLRAWSRAPVLVLSGRSEPDDMVNALDAGADDYVTKPFIPEVLLARLRALQRRAAGLDALEDALVVPIGHYSVDFTAKTVDKQVDAPGKPAQQVHLTRTEWAILEVLVSNAGRLVPGDELHRQVWGPAQENQASHLRFHLSRLRQKLEPEPSRPRQLITEPGMGYRFQP